MIRFQCPDCAKKLSVPDVNAGKIGVCPACKCRIQLPEAPPPEEPDLVDDFAVDEPPKPSPIKRKEDMAPARRRRPVDDEDEDESPLEVERVRKRKRRKKRRREESTSGMFGGIDPYFIVLAVIAVIGVLSILPALFFKPAILLPLAIGGLASVVGRIWFLMVAFQDDSSQGLLCLWFSPYSIIYLLQNFEEAKKPFFLELVGGVILGIACVVLAATGGFPV